jgi:hypothetical protein
VTDKDLGNKTPGGMQILIAQDFQSFHKVLPISDEKNRPSAATTVTLQNKGKRHEGLLVFEMTDFKVLY